MNKTIKRSFSTAFGNLKTCDHKNVKERIMAECELNPQAFSQKKSGERNVVEHSRNGINEVSIIEQIFREFNINAWTGEIIT